MNPRVAIIGTGQHAEVLRDILLDMEPKYSIFLVKFDFIDGSLSFGDALSQELETLFIIGVGDNALRKRLSIQIERLYGSDIWTSAVHPTATVIRSASLGKGVVIGPHAVVGTAAHIGDHCIINTGATVDHHCKIQNFCHIAPKAALCGNVFLGEGTFMGVGACATPNSATKPWLFVKAMALHKSTQHTIPIYEPNFNWIDKTAVNAISDGWISCHGKNVEAASHMLEERCGEGALCLLVNSGTSATHCLFLALKKFHPEVSTIYVPNHVYVAVWNTALYVYKKAQLRVLPTDPESLNIRLDKDILMSLAPRSAIVIVNNIGNMVPLHLIKKERPDIVLIEDNCEGFMGSCTGEILSSHVLCSSVSFFGNKNITTGEGGAVLTRNKDVFEFLRKSCSQGMTQERYIHDTIGYNYRMTNVQAGFLIDQLKYWNEIRSKKEQVYRRYFENLKGCKHIHFPVIHPDTVPSYWMVAIRIMRCFEVNECVKFFKDQDVDIRPFFYHFDVHEHLKNLIPVGQEPHDMHRNVILLPSYPHLPENLIDYISDVVLRYIDNTSYV